MYTESQLCGKADSTHHTQWIITECTRRLHWCTDDLSFNITDPIKWIEQLTISLFIEIDRHCIDGEVSSFLVIIQCTGSDIRFAGSLLIAFFSCTYKFDIQIFSVIFQLKLRSTEVFEIVHIRYRVKLCCCFFCQFNTVTKTDDIQVLGRPAHELITHKAPYQVCFNTQLLCSLSYLIDYKYFSICAIDLHRPQR